MNPQEEPAGARAMASKEDRLGESQERAQNRPEEATRAGVPSRRWCKKRELATREGATRDPTNLTRGSRDLVETPATAPRRETQRSVYFGKECADPMRARRRRASQRRRVRRGADSRGQRVVRRRPAAARSSPSRPPSGTLRPSPRRALPMPSEPTPRRSPKKPRPSPPRPTEVPSRRAPGVQARCPRRWRVGRRRRQLGEQTPRRRAMERGDAEAAAAERRPRGRKTHPRRRAATRRRHQSPHGTRPSTREASGATSARHQPPASPAPRPLQPSWNLRPRPRSGRPHPQEGVFLRPPSSDRRRSRPAAWPARLALRRRRGAGPRRRA